MMKLTRTDGGAGAGQVSLTVDYSSFRHAYGGDWAARLRLVEIPGDGSAAKVLPTSNDVKAGRATADAAVTADGSTFALTAGPNGQTGDYRATSLSPAGTWAVSTQSGDFTYSYPLRTPAAPGGLEPDLALSYSSGSTDGQTAATNNQTSAVGEGWTMWPGSIERGYTGCADDITDPAKKTGDLCWETDNATLSLAGHSSPLVYAGGSTWRPKKDDGSRVERLTGADNGDKGGSEGVGEYWKVTTTDGTQYFFGQTKASAWTVPVFGNEDGEPCKQNTFDASSCDQAYRWNLDKVVDTHGDVVTYTYTPEVNYYARNLNGAKPARYIRGGTLDTVEYGGRTGEHPTAKVVLDHAERGGADVPSDQACAEKQDCGTKFSPTFWSTKRLATVTTQVWDGTAYKDADRWTFEHSYPENTDKTTPSLWLHGITHTGLAAGTAVEGQAVALPQVTFGGAQKPNRLNTDTDGLLPMNKWRIDQVVNESGGAVTVTYHDTDCVPGAPPAPQGNTKRCFPAIWTPDGDVQRNDWMIKYAVRSVALQDRVGGAQTELTTYEYPDGPGWKQDDNPLVPRSRRTWSQFRGYEKVRVLHGDPEKGTPSATLYHYFRGMEGAQVTDSRNVSWPDDDHLAGFLREQITYEGAGGPVVTSVINDPLKHDPTATQGDQKSHLVETAKTTTREALKAGGWRTSEVGTEYNDQGLPTKVNDLGDLAVPDDDQCTTTAYARNEAAWLIDLPSDVRTDGVPCDDKPTYPRDAVSRTRTYYDDGDLGAAPSAGDATKVEKLKEYVDGEPRFVPASRSAFDAYGRVVKETDPLDHTTTTGYSPASGLPASTTVTSVRAPSDPADDQATTTAVDPVLGKPVKVTDPNGRRTELSYDALGRLRGVWLPGRAKGDDSPNTRYAYEVRANAPAWVSTSTLKANGNTTTSYELFDGFLRSRQKQAPGPGPAGEGPLRVLTDTLYDSRGLAFQTNGPYADKGDPGTTLAGVDDTKVPAMSRTTFDGAERPTATAVSSLGDEVSRTTTAYFGDHTEVTPPAGGTPVATYTDAKGRLTKQRRFHAATPTGESDETTYTYTGAGQLRTMTDAAGSTWRYGYDLLGNELTASDPDKGDTTQTFDDAGRLTSTTDARGITVGYRYDDLGRKTEERQKTPDGWKTLAQWTYDTLLKGRPSSSTRHTGTEKITTTVTGYDDAYRPTGTRLTLPASLAPLDGDYTTETTYKADGSPATVTLPALPGAAEETLTYKYDSLGNPYELGSGDHKYVYDAAYTEFGELSQVLSGDQPAAGKTPQQVAQTFYFQNATRRLARAVVHRRGERPGSVQDLTYSYDPAGNVTAMSDRPEIGAADLQCFTYDGLRRLTDAWTTTSTPCGSPGSAAGGQAPYWTSYTYDAVGNRLTETQHGTGTAAAAATAGRRYTYPAPGKARPNAVTSITGTGTAAASAPAAPATGGYQYDDAGNMTGRPGPSGPQTLTWSPQSRLESVTSGPDTTTYRSDADLDQVATTDSKGITVHFGGDEIRYDKATGRATTARRYEFGGGAVAVRGPTGLKWLVHDHHGTDTLAIDAADSATTPRPTDPFGNPRGTAPAWLGSRGFVGGVQQTAGITHLDAREYDPALGRFLSVDPVLDPKDPQQFNAYAYAGNNPTTTADPDGRRYLLENDGSASVPSAQAAKYMGYYKWKWVIYRAARRSWRAHCPATTFSGCRFMGPRQPNIFDPRDINPRYVKPKPAPKSTPKPTSKPKSTKPNDFDRPVLHPAGDAPVPGSLSVCLGGSGAIGYGGSAEGCASFDSNGFALNAGVKQFLTAGAEGAVDLSVTANTDPANQINNGSGVYGEFGGEIGAVAHGKWGAGFEHSLDDGHNSGYVKMGLGLGLGAAFGQAGFSRGVSTGYIKWPWTTTDYIADIPYQGPFKSRNPTDSGMY
ncbi:RHS repeat-associated core domain-containing protein [Actinomadura fibrosa]|nr:RHS repeat-associated core domain-containing protein [Actinomadura fibrosa]